MRYWFNPAAISQHFIIPGAVTIIMTVIGAILTSLVVAREWERGTMEALQEEQEVLGPGRPSVPRMRTPKGQAPRQAALPEARMGQQPGRWS